MEDTFVHKGMRRKLVDELRRKNLFSQAVLDAMMKVPRHLFMAAGLEKLAYKDQALPIAAGQTISQPYTVAFQTELLQIDSGEKILEVGTGSGYQTAVLLELGARVFSIERQKILFDQTQLLLSRLNYNPRLFYGDGYAGLPTYAPFDKILITAGAPAVPDALKYQLRMGGIMVLPVGDKTQKMIRIIRESETLYNYSEHGNFAFVPLLKGKENNL